MRRRLAAGDVPGFGQQRHLLPGRDVQHMNLRARLPGEADEALGRSKRRDFVAPDMMRRVVAGNTMMFALVEALLVLAVERRPPAGRLQDRQHALIVGDQQLSCRGSHEHLDSRRARQAFEDGNVGDIVMRAPDPEGEVAVHAAFGAGELVGERMRRRRQRIGVGHLEDRGHAAQRRRTRSRLQILLVGEAGLAKMHLAVDDAGQDMQARCSRCARPPGRASGCRSRRCARRERRCRVRPRHPG